MCQFSKKNNVFSVDFQVTDADISKEATPAEYIEKILPILLKNGVVHFLGYGNRLGFDPLPSDLQVRNHNIHFYSFSKFVFSNNNS